MQPQTLSCGALFAVQRRWRRALARSGADIVVAHDYFAIRGGGERVALTLAEAFDAELMFGYRTEDSYPAEMFPERRTDLKSPRRRRLPLPRFVTLSATFALSRGRLARFPVRIYSGVASVFGAPADDAGGRDILYCHTPPRWAFDQKRAFAAARNPLVRPIHSAAADLFGLGYRSAVGRMDVIVANSENVRARIRRYLDRDSEVVYPPVDVERFAWTGDQGYFLSTARLHSLKRVDRIVDAFLTMPDQKLVVTSSGPELEGLRRQAARANNIRFTSAVDDAELRRLIGEARATIYVPVDEDFGMSPVESMAAGKPVIGVAEGGLTESVVPGETGVLLPPDFGAGEIAAAVRGFDAATAGRMRTACEARAQLFTRQRFVAAMSEIIGR